MSPHAVHQMGQGRSRKFGHDESSLLQRHDDEEVHDLICIGFGPASLAIAVALHDALELGDTALKTEQPKVRFLERQSSFAWHAGMLLPGTKMQITFIKDLATLRNPRSGFTFLNYLHRNGRLVPFTNLGTFLPQRIEYEDYMRWSAQHFEDVVDYNSDVQSVHVGQKDPKSGRIASFVVNSADKTTGQQTSLHAKNIVIAVGGRPNIPKCLPTNHSRVLHSSQYATNVDDLFRNGRAPRSVAVIGGGQSAAEIFHNIPTRFPGAKSYLLIRGAALRPSDDSPFVNEIFDPEKVDDFYGRDAEIREKSISLDKGTNYGVVRPELLDELYAALYSQRLRYASDDEMPLQILNHRTVLGAEDITKDGNSMLRLQIRNETSNYTSTTQASADETLDVDLVVVASGYLRNAHEDMLKDLKAYLPGSNNSEKQYAVSRDYSIRFKDGVVNNDAGVWLQGCNESTHGLSDTLLSVLANRGGEMVDSIFGLQTGLHNAKINGHANGHVNGTSN